MLLQHWEFKILGLFFFLFFFWSLILGVPKLGNLISPAKAFIGGGGAWGNRAGTSDCLELPESPGKGGGIKEGNQSVDGGSRLGLC